jgi:hypothetical protein
MSESLTISPGDYAELLTLPTQAQGQADDLKVEIREPGTDMTYRVWVSRVAEADFDYHDEPGAALDLVSVEIYRGRWLEGTQYALDRALELFHETGEAGPVFG